MILTFDATILDSEIECVIGSDTLLIAPVFCFSLMAAARAVSGCTLVRAVAGYAEMQLPDIAAGAVHRFRVAHADPGYRVANRASCRWAAICACAMAAPSRCRFCRRG